jgi:TatD DNase family protein
MLQVPRTIKPNKARPGRNEPALLTHVLMHAAEALGEEPAAVATRTTETATRVFGIQF